MPDIDTIIVESIDPKGPYGAKEAGMSIAMSAAQGYAAAVCNAIGVYMDSFPLTPDKILAAIKAKTADQSTRKIESLGATRKN